MIIFNAKKMFGEFLIVAQAEQENYDGSRDKQPAEYKKNKAVKKLDKGGADSKESQRSANIG